MMKYKLHFFWIAVITWLYTNTVPRRWRGLTVEEAHKLQMLLALIDFGEVRARPQSAFSLGICYATLYAYVEEHLPLWPKEIDFEEHEGDEIPW